MDDANKSDVHMEREMALILKTGAYRRSHTGLGPVECRRCGEKNDLRQEGSELCSDCGEALCHG